MREETAEMLIQQGLEEIATVTTSEQIAFLLVERARLLDELEAEQTRSMTATPSDGRASEDLLRTWEKEKAEYEDEIDKNRESLKNTTDRLKKQHEEEINSLMEENSKLEEDLTDVKRKVRIFCICLCQTLYEMYQEPM